MTYYAIDRKFMQEARDIYVPLSIVDEQDWPKDDIDSLSFTLFLLEGYSPDGFGVTLDAPMIARLVRDVRISELWMYVLLAKAILLDLITLMPSAALVCEHNPTAVLNYTEDAKRRTGVV
jgi:hypothetical protein